MQTSVRSFWRPLCAVLCVFCAATTAPAQSKPTTREALVVAPSWLTQHLHDANLVLLHIGEQPEYDAEHIPGARFVDLNRIGTGSKGGLGLEVPPVDSLRAYLSELGISSTSRIVVYYGKNWVTPSTRLILTLDYVGLGASTTMLDGGMPAWVKDGNTPTKEAPVVRTGTLTVLHTQPVIADAEFVKTHVGKPGFAVVDGRAATFYDGVTAGGGPSDTQRAGHIAGAVSIPYNSTWTTGGAWKPAAELEAIFEKAGIKPGDTVIGYCHVGQQATAVLFAARTLGHPVMLYDGSYEDWSAHKDYPVDNPAAKGKQ